LPGVGCIFTDNSTIDIIADIRLNILESGSPQGNYNRTGFGGKICDIRSAASIDRSRNGAGIIEEECIIEIAAGESFNL
jgi:hypothetical protein